jgi:hypothetical protein
VHFRARWSKPELIGYPHEMYQRRGRHFLHHPAELDLHRLFARRQGGGDLFVGQARQPEAGLPALAEALTRVRATEERWWEAELYRLKGELLLQLPILDPHQAEACFQQALDVARSQQAKALE